MSIGSAAAGAMELDAEDITSSSDRMTGLRSNAIPLESLLLQDRLSQPALSLRPQAEHWASHPEVRQWAARPAGVQWAAKNGWNFSLEQRGSIQAGPANQQQFPSALRNRLLISNMQRTVGYWTLRLNVKQQDSDFQGSFRKPALSLTWRSPGSDLAGGLALSRTSRAPGFFTLGHPYGGLAQSGSDKSRQAEMFVATGAPDRLRLRAALFNAYYRDLVDFEVGPPPSLVNRARVYTRGAEASLSHRFREGSMAYLHGAIMRSYDPDSDMPLRYRPHQQVTAGLHTTLADKLRLHASVSWFGRRFDQTAAQTLGGYTEAGLMVSWQSRGGQAFAAIDNLLGRESNDFGEGWATGRRLRMGLQFTY